MKLPRDVSGGNLAKCLCKDWEYRFVYQKGSQLVLKTDAGHRLSIPEHDSLKVGTLHNILLAVANHKAVAIADILDTLR